MRWSDGAPFIHYDKLAVPDVLNAHPKMDADQMDDSLSSAEPLYSFKNTCISATREIFMGMKIHPWHIFDCEKVLPTIFVCEIATTLPEIAPYCMGQTFMVADWCVIHVHSSNVPNAHCESISAGDWDTENARFVNAYREELCAHFAELCNITEPGLLAVQDIRNINYACVLEKPEVVCPARSFQCEDLSCIPESKQCNNIKDCPMGEDEADCAASCELVGSDCQRECTWPKCKCRGDFFQCLRGGCVPAGSVCDYEDNCGDGSDELYCGEPMCPDHHRPCADGRMCVLDSKWFDGTADCADGSDEEITEGADCPGYECHDHSCIPLNLLNDALPDCPDGEDEEEFMLQRAIGHTEWPCERADTLPCKGSVRKCYEKRHQCVYDTDAHGKLYACRNAGHLTHCETAVCKHMFKCPASYCIAFHKVCDGVIDCPGSADENNCPLFSCPGMFRCLAENVCISPAHVCDGHVHCSVAMEDEKYCPHNTGSGITAGQHGINLIEAVDPLYTRILNMQYHNIQEIHQDDTLFDSLVLVIYLDHNNILSISSLVFASFPRLLYLYLSHNIIHSFSFPYRSVAKLQLLDLSHNKLTSLSRKDFEGVQSIVSLDISHNHITNVDEVFFHALGMLESIYHNDVSVCCMVPPTVKCEVRTHFPLQCPDLLIGSYFTYIPFAVGIGQLGPNAVAMFAHLIVNKNMLMVNLALSDALFGIHLLILSISDMFYRNRFAFYAYSWPGSDACLLSMLAVFLSSQQSLLTLLLIMCHTCTLIACPFNKRLHRRLSYGGVLVWLVAALQLAALLLMAYLRQLHFHAYHNLCHLPTLTPTALEQPLNVLLAIVYGLCLFALCSVTCIIAHLVTQSNINIPMHKSSHNVKVRVMKKAIAVVVVNVISFTSLMITEGLVRSGFHIDMQVLQWLSVTVMSASKLCNPWIYAVPFLKTTRSGKRKPTPEKHLLASS
jgi:hypothetical protein